MTKEFGSLPGINFTIKKHIKHGAGLGSSGATSVACVYGLNKIFNLGLNLSQIIEFASIGETVTGGKPHPDNVSAALLGGFVFVKSTNPIKIERINIPRIPVVMCVIKKPQKTTRPFIPNNLPLTKVIEQIIFCTNVIHAIHTANIKSIGEAINYDYISEPVRGKFIPGYNELKKKILNAGAYGCNISGGGSTIFAICEENLTQKIGEIFSNHFTRVNVEHEIVFTYTCNSGVQEI